MVTGSPPAEAGGSGLDVEKEQQRRRQATTRQDMPGLMLSSSTGREPLPACIHWRLAPPALGHRRSGRWTAAGLWLVNMDAGWIRACGLCTRGEGRVQRPDHCISVSIDVNPSQGDMYRVRERSEWLNGSWKNRGSQDMADAILLVTVFDAGIRVY